MCGLSMLFRLLAGSLKCIIRPLTVVINNHTWGNADADAAMTMTPVIDINASSELPINDRATATVNLFMYQKARFASA